MEIPNYIILFITSFCYVFAKSFQQINVSRSIYKWIVPTSLVLATLEAYTVVSMAKSGFHIPMILTIGISAGLGSLTATFLHDKFNKEK